MNASVSKQCKKSEPGTFRLFAEKISMFLRPAKVKELNLSSRESIRLDAVVVIDMSGEQPLVDAFRQVKLMSQRGKRKISVLVNKVHSEVQARSIFNKLVSLCENFLNVELEYLGGVPSDALLKSFHAANDVNNDDSSVSSVLNPDHPKAKSNLDFLQEYWVQTHSLMPLGKKG